MNRIQAFWIGLSAIVIASTLLLFICLQPEHDAPNYWIIMVDIIITEFIAGWALTKSLTASLGDNNGDVTPTAMKISIAVTLAFFLVGGFTLSLILLAISVGSKVLSVLVLIVLLLKWICLLVTVGLMRSAGYEGADKHVARVASRKARTVFVQRLQLGLSELRNVKVISSTTQYQRNLIDRLDLTCNRVRSWVSATPEDETINIQIESAVSVLCEKINSLASATPEEHENVLKQIDRYVREIDSCVSATSVSSRSGVG